MTFDTRAVFGTFVQKSSLENIAAQGWRNGSVRAVWRYRIETITRKGYRLVAE
ncbi:MAG: hypothetical protein FWE95_07135 [Planctomycetaceae bacterium]|nr:hypothetical protein [Planctomycetaceae bacterium]